MQQAVQVLVDEPAIDREFTYLLPPELAAGRVPVTVGTVVEVPLRGGSTSQPQQPTLFDVKAPVRTRPAGRLIRGWVTELDPALPDGVHLQPVNRVLSIGPPQHVVELAKWAAWRWAGTQVHFLRTASADRAVAGAPSEPARRPGIPQPRPSRRPADVREPAAAGAAMLSDSSGSVGIPGWVRAAYSDDRHAPAVVRLGPCADEWPLIAEALRHGRSLVLVPNVAWAAGLAGRLRQAGTSSALVPRDWAEAVSAHAVVGTRAGAWAPCGRLEAVVVLDEHNEAYQEKATPTWNARDVAVERARRDGARCVLVGPMPSPDTLALCGLVPADSTSADLPALLPTTQAETPTTAGPAPATVIAPPRSTQHDAWPRLLIADRRQDDPATGEWCGEALAGLLRSEAVVACVLNRTGRARLAYCNSCGELARSRTTGRALRLDKQQFTDPDTGEIRPAVCESCGATRFRRARLGVKGVASEMERLTQRPVVQVTGENARRETDTDDDGPRTGLPAGAEPALCIGTEAVLHRVRSADAVAFVDFDQELMAPRYRAAEEAFALLIRAARLVGPRSVGGRILVQTRLPAHPVLVAASAADPSGWLRDEYERRTQMRQPPAAAWALVSGAAAPAYIERLSAGSHAGALDIAGPADGTWRIRSDEHAQLLDALAGTERPSGRLRVAVDPMRA
ncbi:hypothetical protein [Candidatus Poriferisodalis sp.]|uniref:hypothetical protein n=1 Tax=Candidatus Poriferisodalis sp. TaxID=3101277 RepID=UPI003B01AEDE